MHKAKLNPIVIHPKSKIANTGEQANLWHRKKILRIIFKIFVTLKLVIRVALVARKKDTVICGTNPEFLFLIIAMLKILLRFRMLVLVHDIFPENTISAQILQKNSFVYVTLKLLFSWAYRVPEDLVVIGRDMKKFISKEKNRQKNTHYIPCWVDHNVIKPEDRNKSSILTKLGLKDRIVFLFFGNIGRLQGIQNLLKGIDLVEHPSASFLFVGTGVFSTVVKDFCSRSPNEKAIYIDNVGNATQSEVLSACDVSLVTLAEGMLGLAVPSKIYFSMAADRPCLAIVDEQSEIGCMVKEKKIGWQCDPGDPIGFAKIVDKICDTYPFTMQTSPRKTLLADYENRENLMRFVSKLS